MAPAEPLAPARSARLATWLDHHARSLFILPAVLMILVFSIFPLIASAILALSRVRLRAGGYNITFVGLANFEKQLFGSEQFHFLGTFAPISPLGWVVTIAVGALLGWWLVRYLRGPIWIFGLIGRMITAAVLFGLTLLFAATLFSGTQFGTLGVTLFYVFVGCTVQFLIGLGLAVLCAQPIRGRAFFRVVFFLPLMITPIGIGYAFRMLADTTKGPFAPVWQWVGLGDFAWVERSPGRRGSSSSSAIPGSGSRSSSWCCSPPSRASRATRSRQAMWTAPAAGRSFARSPGRRSRRSPRP